MPIVKIDQMPVEIPMLLNRGDDMTPWTAKFKNVNFSTAGGYTWAALLLDSLGATLKTLTVTAVFTTPDTIVTASGLTSAESTALPLSGVTWVLKTTAPLKRTYFEGVVVLA